MIVFVYFSDAQGAAGDGTLTTTGTSLGETIVHQAQESLREEDQFRRSRPSTRTVAVSPIRGMASTRSIGSSPMRQNPSEPLSARSSGSATSSTRRLGWNPTSNSRQVAALKQRVATLISQVSHPSPLLLNRTANHPIYRIIMR